MIYEIAQNTVPNYNKNDFIGGIWTQPDNLLKRIKQRDKAKDDLIMIIRKLYSKKVTTS